MTTMTALATCSRCGHVADAHGEQGCRMWLPGTAADPPGPCHCELDSRTVQSKLGPQRALRAVE
jgi:hypothetical protein